MVVYLMPSLQVPTYVFMYMYMHAYVHVCIHIVHKKKEEKLEEKLCPYKRAHVVYRLQWRGCCMYIHVCTMHMYQLGPEDIPLLEKYHLRGKKIYTCTCTCVRVHALASSPGSTKDRHCPLLSSPKDTGRDGLTSPSTSSHDSSSSSSRLQA